MNLHNGLMIPPMNRSGAGAISAGAILASYGNDAHIYLPGAAVPVLGPELVTNGDFSAGSTGWNVTGAWTIGSGKLTGVGTGSTTHADHTASYNSIVPGREYLVTFDVVNITGSSTPTFSLRGGAGAVFPANTGPVSFRYIAGASTFGYGSRFSMTPVGTSLEIDNLSVKEILSYTDTLSGYTVGNWLESTGNTRATVDNPVGLVLDAGTAVGAETTVDPSFDAPANWNLVQPTSGATIVSGGNLRVNSIDGTFANATHTPNIPAIAGKTYRITLVVTAATGTGRITYGGVTATTFTAPGTYVANVVAINTTGLDISRSAACDFTCSDVSVKEVPGIHALQGTTANKPILRKPSNNYYWEFDGVNDALPLSSVPFSLINDHCVIAGITTINPESGSVKRIFWAEKASPTYRVCCIYTAGGTIQGYWSDGVTPYPVSYAPVVNNESLVFSAQKRGSLLLGRKNGVQFGSAITHTYSDAIPTNATIGNDVSGGGLFNGNLYPIIAIKGTVSDDNLLILERWVGSLTGPTGVVIP